MKILSIHADSLTVEPKKKALKEAEILTKKKIECKNCLVIFTAVEKTDEKNEEGSARKLTEEIIKLAEQVKEKNIVLYPYAHLSSSLANPEKANNILKKTEYYLQEKKYNVEQAPFGYYKAFTISCKGHPLSELSRTFTGEEAEEEFNREEVIKKLSKVKMSASPAPKGLKSATEIGRDLDLYIINEVVGSGLPLFTPKGTIIRKEIERFIEEEETKRGYLYTSTPVMAKSDLYKISGHWQHYKKDMFVLQVGNQDFALRPMTCPFQFVLYKRKPRYHHELPLRYAEISTLFRNEQTGELVGLTRLRQFTLADAHIICLPEQLEAEFEKVLDLIKYVTKKLGITDIWYRFSKWDPKNKEKYIDNPKAWEESQKTMKGILNKLKVEYKEAENEAAFYGPKLDIQFKNVYGKEDTLITVQIDFALPERFDLNYLDKENKEKRPIIIHRSSVGCIERTMAYILEKTQGNLPTWLSPVQVLIVSLTDQNQKAAEQLADILRKEGIRVDTDFDSKTIQNKVRKAELNKIPYLIVIGNKEEETKTLSVRKKGEKPKFGVKQEDFIQELLTEIQEKK